VTTHLDDVSDSSSIRQEQVRTILREWDGEKIAIIAGDMNAEPGDLEMSLFSEAGYGDLAEPAGATTTMDDPPKRIDYIWGRGVVSAQAHSLTVAEAVRASDHRPLIVNITRQK
jgi:endonuclease/exonuclease/phosphatase family metal-dependent hydrolase